MAGTFETKTETEAIKIRPVLETSIPARYMYKVSFHRIYAAASHTSESHLMRKLIILHFLSQNIYTNLTEKLSPSFEVIKPCVTLLFLPLDPMENVSYKSYCFGSLM